MKADLSARPSSPLQSDLGDHDDHADLGDHDDNDHAYDRNDATDDDDEGCDDIVERAEGREEPVFL